jgi:transcriptional regulator with XRE-family HTH domain
LITQQTDPTRNPVKEVRQALGLSQEKMARELGCSQNAVWLWERAGSLPPRQDILVKIRSLAKQAGIEIEA